MQNLLNFTILIVGVIVLLFLYQRIQRKQFLQGEREDYKSIQQILADQRDDLATSKLPILWIHIPYEYNARNWQSFGSRGSYDLNQPYLYLTIQSIINKCADSFRISIIDDQSFEKLIPDWNIDMKIVSNPINEKLRGLGLAKLLYIYGGMLVPASFLCMRDLAPMYSKGTSGNKMFVCENVDRNITSTSFDFYPDMNFMGAPKESPTTGKLIEFMQRTISKDFTAQTEFLGEFDRWIEGQAKKGAVNIIPGGEVGVKDGNDEPILLENLMSADPIDVVPSLYGVWIPAKDILSRRKYEWFARMSVDQIVDANIILSKYIVMANIIDGDGGIITELRPKPSWVGFWSVPSQAPVWGLKPDNLGNHMLQLSEPSYAGN